MKIIVIHQWRDWLLEYAGIGKYSFIKRDNKIVVRTIAAKNEMDVENQCQIIIKALKQLLEIESLASVEYFGCHF